MNSDFQRTNPISADFRRLSLAILLVVSLVVGCSDPTQGIVRGMVTIDGEPAESGSISFFPVDGKSPTAGGVIKEGMYEAVVPVGESRVEIRVSKVVGQTRIYNTKDSPIQDVRQEMLPARYNEQSELIYDVPAGKSQKDFELTLEAEK